MLEKVLFVGLLILSNLQQEAKDAFDYAEKKVLTQSIVIPAPVVQKCPCDGKGYIIQGDGHRTECPGTDSGPCKFKKQGAEPKAVSPKEHGVVRVYVREGCLPCRLWKKYVLPLIAKTWKVKEIDLTNVHDDKRAVPFFEVVMNGVAYPVKDLTVESLNKFNDDYRKGKIK